MWSDAENFYLEAHLEAYEGETVLQAARRHNIEIPSLCYLEGLSEWGQSPDRIARFRESVDLSIYTPGSNAGLPLTVLRSFAAPSPAVPMSLTKLRSIFTRSTGKRFR